MATIDLTFASESEFRTKFADTPNDWVAAGNRYRFLQTKKEIVFANPITLEGKVTGPQNDMVIAYVAGASFLDDPAIMDNPFIYDGTKGAAAAIALGYSPGMFLVKMSHVKFIGYQMRQAQGTGASAIKIFAGANYVSTDRCIIDGYGNSQYDWPLEINGDYFTSTNTLILHNSNQAVAAYINSTTATFENTAFIRPGNYTKGGYAVRLINNGGTFKNCAAFGFDTFIQNPGNATVIEHCACSGNIGMVGVNNQEYVTASDVFVSAVNDFRLKKVQGFTNPLIDSGKTPSQGNTLAINGVRQQGTSADIGPWEYPSVLVAPTATVTSIVINGRNVTISGTTTGAPTQGTLSTQKADVVYNSAVPQGPIDLVIGDGVFSCVIPNNVLGEYNFTYEVENAAYKIAGSNTYGGFKIVGPVVTSITQVLDGQYYKLSGTASGNPVSGTVYLKAVAGFGGSDKTFNFVITGNQFRIADGDGLLTAGKYEAGIVLFSTEAGTSQPQPGTSPITIQGLNGNPQMPDAEDVTKPTVNGVNVSPANAILDAEGTLQLTVAVTGENFPPQSVTWTSTKGTVSGTGLFVAHAPTIDEVVTVTATSVADPDFSDTCLITVKAKVVIVDPDPDPEPEPGVKATKAIIDMISPEGVVQANLTGLSVSFFDQIDVGDLLAPVARTKVGTTNAQGQLVMNITGTNLLPGQSGRIVVAKGTKAFTGIVVVS